MTKKKIYSKPFPELRKKKADSTNTSLGVNNKENDATDLDHINTAVTGSDYDPNQNQGDRETYLNSYRTGDSAEQQIESISNIDLLIDSKLNLFKADIYKYIGERLSQKGAVIVTIIAIIAVAVALFFGLRESQKNEIDHLKDELNYKYENRLDKLESNDATQDTVLKNLKSNNEKNK